MSSIELKQQVHGFIEQADNNVLEKIYAILKPTIDQVQLTDEQKEELHSRKEKHLKGESKSYSLQEVKKLLKSPK
jgi:acetolactate synthase small subunit